MKSLQDVRKWLSRRYEYWRSSQESLSIMQNMEDAIGAIALWSIMLLIKIQHIKGGGRTWDSIMRMDGNADNYHELRNYKVPSGGFTGDEVYNELLVKIAFSLLRYGS